MLGSVTMKENKLFSFIWMGPAALFAPDSALVDTGGEFLGGVWRRKLDDMS
jgi:hypothetical protein